MRAEPGNNPSGGPGPPASVRQAGRPPLGPVRRICPSGVQAPSRQAFRPARCVVSDRGVPMISLLEIFDYRLGSSVDLELPKDALQMPVHGPGADTEAVCDFLVDVAFAQGLQNLLLPRR